MDRQLLTYPGNILLYRVQFSGPVINVLAYEPASMYNGTYPKLTNR
jgi:hypothetical protein